MPAMSLDHGQATSGARTPLRGTPAAFLRAAAAAWVATLLSGPPTLASAQDRGSEEPGHGDPHIEHAAYEHAYAENVSLRVERVDDGGEGVMTVRLGPLDLPAKADHHRVAQSPDKVMEMPFEGWIVAYAPRLVDAGGELVPGRLLHHVGFWNLGRDDFLCPNKREHIFGAGGEMNEWVPLPGFGYRVERGERILVNTMFHNPTAVDHPEVWLEVTVRYRAPMAPGSAGRADGAGFERPAVGDGIGGGPRGVTSAYPAWFDVQECGPSAYDLPAGESVTEGRLQVPVGGILLGVGGHLHDYGQELTLYDETRDREVARLPVRLDENGHVLSMPVVPFLAQGGYRLEAGDVLRVEARYDNPTGRLLGDGAMGIVVGYFVPDDDEEMAAFRR